MSMQVNPHIKCPSIFSRAKNYLSYQYRSAGYIYFRNSSSTNGEAR